jgi:putative tryptophan/tyrosine transport system substrate-binding protein
MKRRRLVGLICGTAMIVPFAARAQGTSAPPVVPSLLERDARNRPVIGILLLQSEESAAGRIAAFREGLQLNGLFDGANLDVIVRYVDGNLERLAGFARELAAAGTRAIVTTGTTSVSAVHAAVPAVPIVMAGSADPVAMGFAQSLARPGGNITGVSILGADLIGKRIELLKELVPSARALAVVLQTTNPGNAHFHAAAATAARSLNVEVHVREVGTPGAIDDVFSWAVRESISGVFLIEDPMFVTHRDAIFAAALNLGLPIVTGFVEMVRAGALAGYGVDITSIYRDCGQYVAEILRGADPGSLPIRQPTKFMLSINVKTANALGLVVPESLLARADEVIE